MKAKWTPPFKPPCGKWVNFIEFPSLPLIFLKKLPFSPRGNLRKRLTGGHVGTWLVVDEDDDDDVDVDVDVDS